ncbi:hypothetical protein PL373_11585 [Tenacibaculum maritimum]|nr:hypothetical protein [Tenacibaculum maritimum]MDB0601779.1 hypothetical protein [Tenacibaculum maritimum]MDB0610851.1 hypothetical protein [Tenacibaculum maritimum]
MPKKKVYKKYRAIYLPKVIVDNLLLKLHLGLGDFNYKPEIFISILNDIITKNSIFNKKDSSLNLFSPLDSRYLKSRYGNAYVKHIDFLANNNIIWNDYYFKGKTTYYYLLELNKYIEEYYKLLSIHNIISKDIVTPSCFTIIEHNHSESTEITKDYNSQKSRISTIWYEVKILITSKNKSYLTSSYNEDSSFINNATKHIKKMGSHFRKNFKIDTEKAIEFTTHQYLSNLNIANNEEEKIKAYNKYASRISSIKAIGGGKNLKSIYFNRNKTNGRIDTNLTNLSGDLRQFITGYDDMVYLDLKNSQPVLFNILLKDYLINATEDLKKEIKQYINLTINGNWYEHLQKLYGISRKESKDLWMKIAYSKNKSYLEDKKVFKEAYPNVYKIISSYKTKKHAEFAVKLQQIESDIFIDKICRKLVEKEVIPFTIHDALIIRKEDKEITLEVMESVFIDALGVVPIISEE